ncbi:unnamed protein product [Brachionus calyciflorus]|uniref:Lebercilin domain-containing protein n=1 Tax=Brachionus calyciflorus TaxID=104777 RepID=A0A813W6B4_9BILA|nr:unnamed protein product [Brachionus calyciflorus]
MNRKSRGYSSESDSRSVSRSDSRSRSRSRARTTTRSRSRTRSRSSSPQSRRSASSYTSKRYDTVTKKSTPIGSKSQPVRISKASSETSVNRRQITVGQRRPGVRATQQRQVQQQRPFTEQVSQTTMRIMSAQRLKNNDLNNRLKELTKELEKIKEENKLLQRVHKREEKALKNLENQEHDVSRMIRNHLDEANSLKETIKSLKSDNKRLTSTLIEKDEEIRAMKKKNDDMKKILNDKKLFDNVELNKKLDACEKDLETYKSKYEHLEKKLDVTQSLNPQSNNESPRDVASRREKNRINKKEQITHKPPRPVIREDDKVDDSDRSDQIELEAKLEKEKQEADRRQKEFELELKHKKEQEEKEKKEKEAKRLEAERIKREKALLEEEFKKKAAEEEERKRLEKIKLEEEDRKKRWISENTVKKINDDKNREENAKKDELLAKLSLIEPKKKEQDSLFKLTSLDEADYDKNTLPPRPPPKEEPKNELLSKLFGPNTSSNNPKDDFFSEIKSKEVNRMPWETQEDNFNSQPKKQINNATSFKETNKDDNMDFFSKLNLNSQKGGGIINRPKLDNNKLLFPNIHNKNFVEDIEEIVL